MITTIICDMDGLLSDTETLHIKAYQQTLKHFGYELSEKAYVDHWIRDGLGIAEFVVQHNLTLIPDDVREYKMQIFWEMLQSDLEPMPYAHEFLQRISEKFRLLVASNSYKKNVIAILKNLQMYDFFEMAAFKDSVKVTKPAPDIFLYLTDALKIDPAECVVIEDAEKGIRAAHAAGMKSIAVPNQYTADNNFSLADRIVSSLQDIDIQMIESL